MKVAITGAAGQLGTCLQRLLGTRAAPLSRKDLDITQRDSVWAALERLRPQAVVNTAAYTQVDRAEQDAARCWQVNVAGVEHLAEVCGELDIPLIQLSTDYVFDGDAARTAPFRETDSPNPQGVYARSKRAGEEAAAAAPRHFIVRTCGLYALRSDPRVGGNFVDTVLRLARNRPELSVVDDQIVGPTYAPHLARALEFLLTTEAYGHYHIVNAGAVSWFEFASAIVEKCGLPTQLQRITTEQYGAAAPRPRYSVLDTTKYEALNGPRLPRWDAALDEYLAELRAAGRLA